MPLRSPDDHRGTCLDIERFNNCSYVREKKYVKNVQQKTYVEETEELYQREPAIVYIDI